MSNVTIYTKRWCPYCTIAKFNLDRLGVSYEEIDVTMDRGREREMIERAGRTSVPQIFLGDHHVGGSDDLTVAIDSGEFQRLLDASVRMETSQDTRP